MRGIVRLVGGCLLAGVLVAALMAPFVVGSGLAAGRVAATAASISPTSLDGETPLVTTVTDRNGAPIATVFDQYRLPLSAKQVPDTLKAAIISIEDRHFYTEHGVDPTAVLRALVNDIDGGPTQGGSTITQQLVKNYLINVVDRNDPAAQQADRADTLTRKIREARSAIELDQSTDKDDILTDYLNVVEFTGRVYGAAAAAQAYFGVSVDKLNLQQAALLAGMVNNPTLFDPYNHPEAALKRRNQVLDAMAGTGSVDRHTADETKQTPLGVVPGGPNVPASTCAGAAPDAGFLCQYALTYLTSAAGLSSDQLATGGYTVRTTLDPTVSQAAKDAVNANVPTTQDGVANTMAIVSPGSDRHEVLAMVANRNLGTDAGQGQTSSNIVSEVSDPFGAGSVFKIFTSAAAVESGKAELDTQLPNPSTGCFALSGRKCYTVHNDGDYPDPITLADGLATSPNTAFVGLETRVGMPAVLDMASRLGLRTTMKSNDEGKAPDTSSDDTQLNQPQSQYFLDKPSFTLGNSPVSPLELANVSATLMSDGTWCPPDPVQSLTDRFGHDVALHREACSQAVTPDVARTIVAGLGKDTTIGTSAQAARNARWTRPGIGKTGTTQTSESVAFVGGSGPYAVSSLVFADGSEPGELCPGPPVHLGNCGHGAFGGTAAAPPYFHALNELLG
ncbi:transglycosylase domain-containing protein [Actinophytocola oryzae]|uniref:Membrane peptidoglycan carboxypeptidase n=1 Tax=Actinophytocola oryzae TaxID=502181 RepID=A0A4R7VFH1_9PSEU|nr:transglycosylase domain-containing protein [Actinophytocola oryzae]TDV47845.1 membrane peptidoglycan carboxypeptidase [Actinophytocola oryzae]